MLRRDFLSGSSLAIGLTAAGIGSAGPISSAKSLLDYGAKPDGRTLNTKAIQRAIDDAFQAGGGLVYAPPGTFLTGGLELKSRVTLYLSAGCVLLGSGSLDDYAYHPGPHTEGDANGHHLIFAQNADDVTLCGPGTVDGQGSAFWQNRNTPWTSPEEARKNGAMWYYHYKVKDDDRRPSPMVEFAQCRNLRISGITLKNSSGWTLRPIACQGVVIDGVRIHNPNYGPNTDGMDITCSSNVFVSNCDIFTGDDAICLKSENPYGEVLPSRNITITNCTLVTPLNAFKIGTATQGAFENIAFSNSVIYSESSSPQQERTIGGIAIEMVDGGSVDGVVISNIRMQNVRTPVFVRLGERRKKEGAFLRNVLIEGVDASGTSATSAITGVPGLRPSDITISNCRFRTAERGQKDWTLREIPEQVDQYPGPGKTGKLPAYGFYVRHADRIRLRNVEYIADESDERPAIVCDDVDDIILAGLELSAPASGAPLMDLRETRRALLTGMRAPLECGHFAQVSGAGSSGITLMANALNPGQRPVTITGGAEQDSTRII